MEEEISETLNKLSSPEGETIENLVEASPVERGIVEEMLLHKARTNQLFFKLKEDETRVYLNPLPALAKGAWAAYLETDTKEDLREKFDNLREKNQEFITATGFDSPRKALEKLQENEETMPDDEFERKIQSVQEWQQTYAALVWATIALEIYEIIEEELELLPLEVKGEYGGASSIEEVEERVKKTGPHAW